MNVHLVESERNIPAEHAIHFGKAGNDNTVVEK